MEEPLLEPQMIIEEDGVYYCWRKDGVPISPMFNSFEEADEWYEKWYSEQAEENK